MPPIGEAGGKFPRHSRSFGPQAKKNYVRYILISGQDIPIVDNETIQSFFEQNPETDYFAYFTRETATARLADEEKLSLIWFSRNRNRSRVLAIDLARRIWSKAVFLTETCVQSAQRMFRLYRRPPCRIWGGENWVNLTGKTMDAFLLFIDANPSFLKSFKYTKSGDEMIVQMALLEHICPPSVKNTSLRYVDFVSGPEDPRILRAEDFGKVVSSGMLFARKADENVDGEIINMLYSRGTKAWTE